MDKVSYKSCGHNIAGHLDFISGELEGKGLHNIFAIFSYGEVIAVHDFDKGWILTNKDLTPGKRRHLNKVKKSIIRFIEKDSYVLWLYYDEYTLTNV